MLYYIIIIIIVLKISPSGSIPEEA